MKVVSFKICPFVQRVTALLEAKGNTYDIEYISLSEKPEWFLELSPNGQVPILIIDNKQVIFESDAIAEYIEEVSSGPLFFDTDPILKAQERAWSYLGTKNYLVQCSAQRSPSEDVLVERANKLRTAFAKLESKLSGERFFNGQSIGMVDIAWLPLLHRASIIHKYSGYDFIAGFTKVKALQENLLATGLPQRSVTSDFEEKVYCLLFIGRYLSRPTTVK